ncbi:MFS transporter [Flavobacterium alvei]|uniref:MFS transporter n=1 Tax=Flavobacterium alvei TaxID=2080416 RepID=UPI0026F1EFB2|nr:MFS transporter [Flavobacterium alvei]
MTQKIKTLQNIHLAICAGIIIVYFIIGNLSIEGLTIKTIDSSEIVFVAIPFLAFILSNFFFKSQLKQVNAKMNPEENLPIYQTASIMRWAILEGAAFFILFVSPKFQLLGIITIAYLAILRPTEDRIIKDLQNTGH